MDELPPIKNPEIPEPEKPNTDANADKIDDLIAALAAMNRENQDANKAHYSDQNRHENRMFWMELIGLFLITVYATFTIAEWNVFNRERKTMENELQMMHDQNVMDERAWVFPRDQTWGIDNTNNYWKTRFVNSGKTPALNVVFQIGDTEDTNLIPTNDESPEYYGPKANGSIIAPGAFVDGRSVNVPDRAINDVHNGQCLYIYGHVWYEDVFGNHHWSQFCYFFSNNVAYSNSLEEAHFANFHNSTDDTAKNNQK
jgi:hypothetical protein